jgi:rhomboid protease GluP
LAVTVAVFIGQSISEALLGQDWFAILGLKENTAIAQGQWWRLFTPMLLHGSVIHITFNMYALYVLGGELERYFGRGRFLALYLISGFAGNVFSFMFTKNPSLGASTAIFGLLGAQAVFIYSNRGNLGTGYRRALNQIIGIAAINLIIGLADFIDNWGHIGGLVGGSLFAWLGGPIFKVTGDEPPFKVTDERKPADVTRAIIWTGLLFLFLALVTILFRLN